MKTETAGDPMTGLKWTKKATAKIAVELGRVGIVVDAKTVGRLLVKMGFTLKTCRKILRPAVNIKQIIGSEGTNSFGM